jgi:hypothetical protein
MDQEVAANLDEFCRQNCAPDAWNFITTGLHNGDLYHFLTLLRPFKTLRAGRHPVRLIATSKPHLAIANLFADRVDEITYTPAPDFTGPQLSEWRVATGRDKFAPGELINMLPHDYFRPPLQFGPLWFMLNDRAMFYIHLMKLLLNLPLSIAPDLPVVTAQARDEARTLFQQRDLAEGRSLILFPYQHSHPRGFTYTQECFAALAARATAVGLHVYTSIGPGEEPIEGTTGIFIPFSIVVPFCELAGHVVVWRSGLSDMLVTARCANVGIYHSRSWLESHSPICYNLGGSERGLVFDLDNRSDPQNFAETVLATLVGAEPSDGSACIPGQIRELLALRLRPDRPNGLFRQQDFVIRHDWGRVFTSGVLGEGWSGLEPWGIWSQGYRSILYLKPALPTSFDPAELGDRQMVLVLDLQFAIARETHEVLHYTVEVNAEATAHEAQWPHRGRVLRIRLRPEQLRMPLRITFTVDNPATTRALSGGKSNDDRLIGIGLGRACYELVAPD